MIAEIYMYGNAQVHFLIYWLTESCTHTHVVLKARSHNHIYIYLTIQLCLFCVQLQIVSHAKVFRHILWLKFRESKFIISIMYTKDMDTNIYMLFISKWLEQNCSATLVRGSRQYVSVCLLASLLIYLYIYLFILRFSKSFHFLYVRLETCANICAQLYTYVSSKEIFFRRIQTMTML